MEQHIHLLPSMLAAVLNYVIIPRIHLVRDLLFSLLSIRGAGVPSPYQGILPHHLLLLVLLLEIDRQLGLVGAKDRGESSAGGQAACSHYHNHPRQ